MRLISSTRGLSSGGLETKRGLVVGLAETVCPILSARVLSTFLSPGGDEVPGSGGGYINRDSGRGWTETTRSTRSARALPSRAGDGDADVPGPSKGLWIRGWAGGMRTVDVPLSRGGTVAAVIPDEGSGPLGSVLVRVWPCSSGRWGARALPIGFRELFRTAGAIDSRTKIAVSSKGGKEKI